MDPPLQKFLALSSTFAMVGDLLLLVSSWRQRRRRRRSRVRAWEQQLPRLSPEIGYFTTASVWYVRIYFFKPNMVHGLYVHSGLSLSLGSVVNARRCEWVYLKRFLEQEAEAISKTRIQIQQNSHLGKLRLFYNCHFLLLDTAWGAHNKAIFVLHNPHTGRQTSHHFSFSTLWH